jgi:membrane protein
VPDVHVPWRDVWAGAVLAGILFTIGKYLLALYLTRTSVASAYGAAGSLAVVLVWVYYSSQILLFGAEFTRSEARRHGSECAPMRDAVRLPLAA